MAHTGSITKRPCSLQNQIVFRRADLAGERTDALQAEMIGGARGNPVAVGAECENRLDAMPPVGQLAAHMKRKVELCRRRLREIHQGAAVAGVSPASILAFTRPAISSSAVMSAADHA